MPKIKGMEGQSLHKNGGWKRIYKKMRLALSNVKSHPSDDSLNNFFQNAYHLKEWIEVEHPDLKEKLVELWKGHNDLQCCRDICNGFKHGNLTKSSVDADWKLIRAYDPLHSDPPFFFLIADKQVNAIELADSCAQIWTNWLKEQSLLDP